MRPPRFTVDVVFLPRDLRASQWEGKSAVVFDVLRATTTMTAALAAGVSEIRIFDDLESAARAAGEFDRHPSPSADSAENPGTSAVRGRVLCGERHCLRPPGFDLGNSPAGFTAAHAGRVAFMCTTNGTRAVVSARLAAELRVGALVNAAAVARRLLRSGLDVTLLCAGTGGEVALEDALGAGAVIDALLDAAADRAPDGEARASGIGGRDALAPVVPACVSLASDAARMALRLFRAARHDLPGALADATGGRNVIEAGLPGDVEFAARLDVFDGVGRVVPASVGDGPLRVVAESV